MLSVSLDLWEATDRKALWEEEVAGEREVWSGSVEEPVRKDRNCDLEIQQQ